LLGTNYYIVNTWVNRVWLEVNALNVHLVYYELLIHPLTTQCNCKKRFGLAFRNRSTTKQGLPSWFAIIQEKQNHVQNMDLWIFAMISPIMFLIHSQMCYYCRARVRTYKWTHISYTLQFHFSFTTIAQNQKKKNSTPLHL
jgi:hypothetical protein